MYTVTVRGSLRKRHFLSAESLGATAGLYACLISSSALLNGCALLIDPPSERVSPAPPFLSATPSAPKSQDDLQVTVMNPQDFVDYDFEWCRFDDEDDTECDTVTDGVEITALSTSLPALDVYKRFPERWR